MTIHFYYRVSEGSFEPSISCMTSRECGVRKKLRTDTEQNKDKIAPIPVT